MRQGGRFRRAGEVDRGLAGSPRQFLTSVVDPSGFLYGAQMALGVRIRCLLAGFDMVMLVAAC